MAVTDNIEALKKAMFLADHKPGCDALSDADVGVPMEAVNWERAWEGTIKAPVYGRLARAALSFLGFDEANPPAENAVRVALNAIITEQCHCREYKRLEKPGCQECRTVNTCLIVKAVAALEGKSDG